jgi:wingless-type MMTV integration site family protein 8
MNVSAIVAAKNLKKSFRKYDMDVKCNLNNVFATFLANKEAAFIHAITSAGVMHSVILNCSLGHLENCRCQPKNRQKVRSKSSVAAENWHWGGCSDNIAFGDLVARHFVDALEGKRGDSDDDRRTLNLHNNKVGRKVSWSLLV